MTDTPASIALEELKAAALDVSKCDPENPQGAGTRYVSALHMAYQSGASWDDILDASGIIKETE